MFLLPFLAAGPLRNAAAPAPRQASPSQSFGISPQWAEAYLTSLFAQISRGVRGLGSADDSFSPSSLSLPALHLPSAQASGPLGDWITGLGYNVLGDISSGVGELASLSAGGSERPAVGLSGVRPLPARARRTETFNEPNARAVRAAMREGARPAARAGRPFRSRRLVARPPLMAVSSMGGFARGGFRPLRAEAEN